MPDTHQFQTDSLPGRAQRLRVIAHLQAIEGNPLTAEEIEMFEMFEREGWSPERTLEYILAKVLPQDAG